MKKISLLFALFIGLLAFTTAQAQNMSSYITLTVKNGAKIKLKLNAATDGTPVKIKSGSNEQIVTVNKAQGTFNYTATDTIMTVYGDVTIFHCNYNKANITALDPSHNTGLLELNCSSDSIRSLDVTKNTSLTLLDCYSTRLSTLDVTKNTELARLFCGSNKLSSLDVTKNTKLTKLRCFFNNLSTLDVTKNTQLVELNCHSNRFTSLDVTNNTMLKELICRDNRLTSLDIRRNTQLEKLHCYGNAFSTASLDTIYCSLPDRLPADMAKICPLVSDSDPNKPIVLATNKQNAIAKNWKIQYQTTSTDIPATTGSYVCSNSGGGNNVNMSSYITLTVAKDSSIKLDFMAAAAGTPVRIVSGSNTQDITVGIYWYDGSQPSTFTVTAQGTEMKVYGDIVAFNCSSNKTNLTALDVSNNTQLTILDCSRNNLSSLDVSQNTQLTNLYCFFNQLTALDVTKNTALTELSCSSNQLSSLDLSKNTELLILNCKDNKLTSLDISKNTKLKTLYCLGNNFSTQALDDIYCALPVRQVSDAARIYPLKDSSDPNHATILATNKTNATAKNWKVRYYDDTDIPATTGNYDCSGVSTDIAIAEPQFTFYPNPVSDVLYLSATARTIRIYNIYGIEVAHATDTDRIDVAHLPEGVYTVKADGTVAKMVKR